MTPTFTPHIQVTLLWILSTHASIPIRDYHPLWYSFPGDFLSGNSRRKTVQTPHFPYISVKDSVCLIPLSVALTYGISIDFFSCGYWDASLPRVLDPEGSYREVSFRDLRIKGCMHLPEAYRSLPRPSSTLEQSHPPNSVVVVFNKEDRRFYSTLACGVIWTLDTMHGVINVQRHLDRPPHTFRMLWR